MSKGRDHGSPLYRSSGQGWPGFPTTHVERPPFYYLLFSLEGGLDDLPLRVSNEA